MRSRNATRRTGLAALLAMLALSAPLAGARAAAPAGYAPIRMSVLGDSLAFGTGATDPANALAFRIYRALLATHPGSEVTNEAIGGSRVADVTRLQVPALDPHANLVFVIAGGNDVVRRTPPAAFAADYAALLAGIRARAPHAAVVVCGVPDVARSPLFADSFAKTEALSRIDDLAVRRSARAAGAAYVDLFTITRRLGTNPAFFSSDDFHPSDAGYAHLADAAMPVVLKALVTRHI